MDSDNNQQKMLKPLGKGESYNVRTRLIEQLTKLISITKGRTTRHDVTLIGRKFTTNIYGIFLF